VAGLLISLVAGAVASIALARLTEFEWRARQRDEGPGSGRVSAGGVVAVSVLLLVCAPAAVFLAAGYTESLFLALGVPAWLAARRHRWILAGILTGLACTVRIDGAFEAAGIAVMFLLSRPRAGDWARSPALLLPLVAVGGYFAYLKDVTGDWLAWLHAEQQGWSRRLTNPVTAFRNSWANASGSGSLAGGRGFGRGGARAPGGLGRGGSGTGGPGRGGGFGGSGPRNGSGSRGGFGQRGQGSASGTGSGSGSRTGPGSGSAGPAGAGGTATAPGQHALAGTGGHGLGGVGPFGPWPFRLDILLVLAGLAFMAWAVFRRRWAELVYVGIAVVSLATSTYYMSVAREALLWWPLWISLAIWLTRRRWLTALYLAASTAAMVGIACLFLSGNWAG
jgi:hypothetical protein